MPPNSFTEWMVGRNVRRRPAPPAPRRVVTLEVSTDDESGTDSYSVTVPRTQKKPPTPKKVRFHGAPAKSALKSDVRFVSTPLEAELASNSESDISSDEESINDTSEDEPTDLEPLSGCPCTKRVTPSKKATSKRRKTRRLISTSSEEESDDASMIHAEHLAKKAQEAYDKAARIAKEARKANGSRRGRKNKKQESTGSDSSSISQSVSSEDEDTEDETEDQKPMIKKKQMNKGNPPKKKRSKPKTDTETETETETQGETETDTKTDSETEEDSHEEANSEKKKKKKGNKAHQNSKSKSKASTKNSAEDESQPNTKEGSNKNEGNSEKENENKGKKQSSTANQDKPEEDESKDEEQGQATKEKVGGSQQQAKGSSFLEPPSRNFLMPPRSQILHIEHAMEAPGDPNPNAFYDSENGVMRVYYGPKYSYSNETLYPRRVYPDCNFAGAAPPFSYLPMYNPNPITWSRNVQPYPVPQQPYPAPPEAQFQGWGTVKVGPDHSNGVVAENPNACINTNGAKGVSFGESPSLRAAQMQANRNKEELPPAAANAKFGGSVGSSAVRRAGDGGKESWGTQNASGSANVNKRGESDSGKAVDNIIAKDKADLKSNADRWSNRGSKEGSQKNEPSPVKSSDNAEMISDWVKNNNNNNNGSTNDPFNVSNTNGAEIRWDNDNKSNKSNNSNRACFNNGTSDGTSPQKEISPTQSMPGAFIESADVQKDAWDTGTFGDPARDWAGGDPSAAQDTGGFWDTAEGQADLKGDKADEKEAEAIQW